MIEYPNSIFVQNCNVFTFIVVATLICKLQFVYYIYNVFIGDSLTHLLAVLHLAVIVLMGNFKIPLLYIVSLYCRNYTRVLPNYLKIELKPEKLNESKIYFCNSNFIVGSHRIKDVPLRYL